MISKWRFSFFTILIALTIKAEDNDEEKKISTIQKLHQKLLANYDWKIRPVTHHSNITQVYFSLTPFQIVKLDEDLSLLWMDSRLFLTWKDYRLQWNPSEYDGIQRIRLPYHLVWHPDIVVFNWHSGWIDPKFAAPMILLSTGTVLFVPPAVLVTRCPIKLIGSYPNDKLICDIVFGAYGTDGFKTDLQISNDKVRLHRFSNTNPRWELLDDAKLIRNVKYYDCCADPHITVTVSLPMKRRPPSELQVTQAPCILIMSLALMMFLIPVNPDKKVILGGFLIFILCILMTYVAFVTKSPTSVFRAVTFLKTTLCVVSLATTLEFLIIGLRTYTASRQPPAILIRAFTNPLTRYLAIWPPWETINPSNKMRLRENEDEIFHSPSAEEEWTLVTTCLDRLFFIVFIIVLTTVHQI